MCFGCQCPQPVPPPNQTLAKCRKYLQGLAIGLLVVGGFGLACGQVMQFIFGFLLIYLLYIGWTTFNWCMVLGFFMFCAMQSIQSIILFIGMYLFSLLSIQYGEFFKKGNIVISLYALLILNYYPIALFISHYCYKHFKNNFQGNNQFFMGGPGGNNGGGQQVGGGLGGRYQRMVDDRVEEQQPRRQGNQNTNNNSSQRYFGGQGVRIG